MALTQPMCVVSAVSTPPVVTHEGAKTLSVLMDDLKMPAAALLDGHHLVELSRTEMAVIIGALLQAEATLPLIDARYGSLNYLESLRNQQLSLANRLEDILAESHPPCPAAGIRPQPWQDRADGIPAESGGS